MAMAGSHGRKGARLWAVTTRARAAAAHSVYHAKMHAPFEEFSFEPAPRIVELLARA